MTSELQRDIAEIEAALEKAHSYQREDWKRREAAWQRLKARLTPDREWQPIETAPKDGESVYLRVVRASKKRPKPTPAHVEAWLYEVRFNGTGKNPPTDWQRYGVYTSRADAERGMAVCGGELEGRVTPLVRAAALAAKGDKS